MNRVQLAELLATTHGQSRNPDSHTRSQHSKNTNAPAADPPASLSPRQIFQSRVRTLSDDGSTSPTRSPHKPRSELQRLSTLRVHVTSPTSARTFTSPQKQHTRDGRFGYSPYEPNFIAEERAAWTTTSPRRATTLNKAESWVDDDAESLVLSRGSRSSSIASTTAPPLRSFGPSTESSDQHERPKTSRGNPMPGSFPGQQSEPDRSDKHTRRSKFFEGSMNERSVGVSSTWEVHGERLSEEHSSAGNDSDSTPRASRFSTDSINSSDLSEFQPASTTPATLKQRLSRFASTFRLHEEPANPFITEKPQTKQKGLRKSISTWSFHNLSDKVKFFGASASDAPVIGHQQSKNEDAERIAVLDDRKRKAEEAYAQQFGTKKQKNNDGIATEDRNRMVRSPPKTLKKRSASAQRTPTTRRRRIVSASTFVPPEDPADVSEAEDLDIRKRPSRRELEKENQQLRAMLREREAQTRGNLQLSASRSSLHLPLQDRDDSADAVAAAAPTPKPKKTQKQPRKATVPPVPPLPTKAALAALGNKAHLHYNPGSQKAQSTWKDAGTVKRVTRSQNTVLPVEVDSENIDPSLSVSAPKGDWQWPDDVF